MIMRKSLGILFMILLAQACFSQDSAGAEKTPRQLLVSVDAQPEAGYTAQETVILEKSLALSLQKALRGIHLIEYAQAGFPQALNARNSEAERLGANCWLWVNISGGSGASALLVQFYDMLTQTLVVDEIFTRKQKLDPLEASREHWEEIVSLVKQKYSAVDTSQVPRNERHTITLVIHALPDTMITGLPGGPLVASEYGVATANLDAPSSYHLRAALDGYYPAHQDVYVDADRDLQIIQKPASGWSVEASFFNAFFFDGNAGYYFLPNVAFLKVGVTSFLVGLALNQTSLTYSYPLVYANIQLGRYWAPADAVVRPYAAMGGFIRIVSIGGFPLRIDALSPGGFQLNVGAEVPLAGKSKFFFEYIPMLYLSSYPDLFVDSLGSNGIPFGYVPVSIGAFDFANVRFGVRWML
jgi:hypothetical protein